MLPKRALPLLKAAQHPVIARLFAPGARLGAGGYRLAVGLAARISQKCRFVACRRRAGIGTENWVSHGTYKAR